MRPTIDDVDITNKELFIHYLSLFLSSLFFSFVWLEAEFPHNQVLFNDLLILSFVIMVLALTIQIIREVIYLFIEWLLTKGKN